MISSINYLLMKYELIIFVFNISNIYLADCWELHSTGVTSSTASSLGGCVVVSIC